jgi:hypothetical protein
MASAVQTRLIPALMLLVVIGAIWWARRKPPQSFPDAYVNDRSAIVWNTTAQVRERVADLTYGQKVSVLGHLGDETQVRTDGGVEGWVDTQLLLAPELWQRSSDLLTRARAMPVQAVGHTRAPSNVHIDPSRTATRVFQFARDARVVVLQRRVTPAPASAAAAAPPPAATAPEASGGAAPAASPDDNAVESGKEQPKEEDWLLVLHEPGPPAIATINASAQVSPSDTTPQSSAAADLPIAGWVLARFIELDPPATVADNASSAGLRIAAWMVLNSVTDAAGSHPQYLLAGAHGGEGQPCDFTALRVYTWSSPRARYETAYVESDLCGQFPIRTSAAPDGAEFRFAELDENDAQRTYLMKQTIVRRVREDKPPATARAH